MGKKDNFKQIFDTIVESGGETSQEPLIQPESETPETKAKLQSVFVHADFGVNISEIGYTHLATGEQNIVAVSNGKFHMLQGRIYYIPVNIKNVKSDEYIIKVPSISAEIFDVRFVTDGLAAVVPLKHNSIVKNGERLCILTPISC